MPTLNDATADAWAAKLAACRALIIASWAAFVLVPRRFPQLAAVCFAAGAAAYVMLGGIVVTLHQTRTIQGLSLFLVGAAAAVFEPCGIKYAASTRP